MCDILVTHIYLLVISFWSVSYIVLQTIAVHSLIYYINISLQTWIISVHSDRGVVLCWLTETSYPTLWTVCVMESLTLWCGAPQHWEAFQYITEIFILVPALLGLKGNLEMTLASRLSTAVRDAHLPPWSFKGSTLEPTLRCASKCLIQNKTCRVAAELGCCLGSVCFFTLTFSLLHPNWLPVSTWTDGLSVRQRFPSHKVYPRAAHCGAFARQHTSSWLHPLLLSKVLFSRPLPTNHEVKELNVKQEL